MISSFHRKSASLYGGVLIKQQERRAEEWPSFKKK